MTFIVFAKDVFTPDNSLIMQAESASLLYNFIDKIPNNVIVCLV